MDQNWVAQPNQQFFMLDTKNRPKSSKISGPPRSLILSQAQFLRSGTVCDSKNREAQLDGFLAPVRSQLEKHQRS